MKYLLPCNCGAAIPVETGQAGEVITCSCGATVDVPTMRALRQLEPAPLDRPATAWSRSQGALFVAGLVCLLIGTIATVALSRKIPAAKLFPNYTYRAVMDPVSYDQIYFRRGPLLVAMAADLDQRRRSLSPAETLTLWGLYRDVPAVMQSLPGIRREHAARRSRYRWLTGIAALGTAVASLGLLGGAYYLGGASRSVERREA